MSRRDAKGLVVIMTPMLKMPRRDASAKIFVADCGGLSKAPSVRDTLNKRLDLARTRPRARRQITGIKKSGQKKAPHGANHVGLRVLSVPLNHERYLRFVPAFRVSGGITTGAG